MAEPQQVTIQVSADASASPADRAALAAQIIEFIRQRSEAGVGVRKQGRGFSNYEFPEYTKEYEDLKGQDNVDLTLSAEMLSSIEYFASKSRRGEITIGFKSGTKINAKAEGNQIGSYGRAPNPKKARRFLGMTKSELELIGAL